MCTISPIMFMFKHISAECLEKWRRLKPPARVVLPFLARSSGKKYHLLSFMKMTRLWLNILCHAKAHRLVITSHITGRCVSDFVVSIYAMLCLIWAWLCRVPTGTVSVPNLACDPGSSSMPCWKRKYAMLKKGRVPYASATTLATEKVKMQQLKCSNIL